MKTVFNFLSILLLVSSSLAATVPGLAGTIACIGSHGLFAAPSTEVECSGEEGLGVKMIDLEEDVFLRSKRTGSDCACAPFAADRQAHSPRPAEQDRRMVAILDRSAPLPAQSRPSARASCRVSPPERADGGIPFLFALRTVVLRT